MTIKQINPYILRRSQIASSFTCLWLRAWPDLIAFLAASWGGASQSIEEERLFSKPWRRQVCESRLWGATFSWEHLHRLCRRADEGFEILEKISSLLDHRSVSTTGRSRGNYVKICFLKSLLFHQGWGQRWLGDILDIALEMKRQICYTSPS